MPDKSIKIPRQDLDAEVAQKTVSAACKGIYDLISTWPVLQDRTLSRFVTELRTACQADPSEESVRWLKCLRSPMTETVRDVWLDWCDFAPVVFGPQADPADPVPYVDWLVAGFDPARAGLYLNAGIPMVQALALECDPTGPPSQDGLAVLAGLYGLARRRC